MSTNIKKMLLESEMTNHVQHRTVAVHPSDYPYIYPFDPRVFSDPQVPSLGNTHVLLKHCSRRAYTHMLEGIITPCRFILVSPSYTQYADAWDFLVANNLNPTQDMIVIAKFSQYDYTKRLLPHGARACQNHFLQHVNLFESRFTGGGFYDVDDVEHYVNFLQGYSTHVYYLLSVHVAYFFDLSILSRMFEVNPYLKCFQIMNLPHQIVSNPVNRYVYASYEHGYILSISQHGIEFQGLNTITESGEKVYYHPSNSIEIWRSYLYTHNPLHRMFNTEQHSYGVTKLVVSLREDCSRYISNCFISNSIYSLKKFGDIIVPKTVSDRIRSLVRSLQEEVNEKGHVVKNRKRDIMLIMAGVASREAALQLFAFDTVAYIAGVPHLVLPEIIDFELRHAYEEGYLQKVLSYFRKEGIREFDYHHVDNGLELNSIFKGLLVSSLLGYLGYLTIKRSFSELFNAEFAWVYYGELNFFQKFFAYDGLIFSNKLHISDISYIDQEPNTPIISSFLNEDYQTLGFSSLASIATYPHTFDISDFHLQYQSVEVRPVPVKIIVQGKTFFACAPILPNSVYVYKYSEVVVMTMQGRNQFDSDIANYFTLKKTVSGVCVSVATRSSLQNVPAGRPVSVANNILAPLPTPKISVGQKSAKKTDKATSEKMIQRDFTIADNDIVYDNTVIDCRLPAPKEMLWGPGAKEVNPLPYHAKYKNLCVAAFGIRLALEAKAKHIVYIGYAQNYELFQLFQQASKDRNFSYGMYELKRFHDLALANEASKGINLYLGEELPKLLDGTIPVSDIFIISDAYVSGEGVEVVEIASLKGKIQGFWKARTKNVMRGFIYVPPFGNTFGGIPNEVYITNYGSYAKKVAKLDSVMSFYPKYCTLYPFPTAGMCCISCFRMQHLLPGYERKCNGVSTPNRTEYFGYQIDDFFGPVQKRSVTTTDSDPRITAFIAAPGAGKTKGVIKGILTKANIDKLNVLYTSPVSRVRNDLQSQMMPLQFGKRVMYAPTQHLPNESFDIVIIDEFYAVSTAELHSIIKKYQGARFFLLGDPLQVKAMHEFSQVKKDAVTELHIPAECDIFYKKISYTVPHRILQFINERFAGPIYKDTCFTRNIKHGVVSQDHKRKVLYDVLKKRAKNIAACEGTDKILMLTFSNVGLNVAKEVEDVSSGRCEHCTAHASIGCRAYSVVYMCTTDEVNRYPAHCYVAATRTTELFEIRTVGEPSMNILGDYNVYTDLAQAFIAPILENLSNYYLQTNLAQGVREGQFSSSNSLRACKYLSFFTYDYSNALIGLASHMIHNYFVLRINNVRHRRVFAISVHTLAFMFSEFLMPTQTRILVAGAIKYLIFYGLSYELQHTYIDVFKSRIYLTNVLPLIATMYNLIMDGAGIRQWIVSMLYTLMFLQGGFVSDCNNSVHVLFKNLCSFFRSALHRVSSFVPLTPREHKLIDAFKDYASGLPKPEVYSVSEITMIVTEAPSIIKQVYLGYADSTRFVTFKPIVDFVRKFSRLVTMNRTSTDLNALPIFRLNTKIEEIPEFILQFANDSSRFRKALRAHYEAFKKDIVYTKAKIPFPNRVVDVRVNNTQPVNVADVDHVQVEEGFINKSATVHGSTGRYNYPKTELFIINKPLLSLISNYSKRQSIHKYTVRVPRRVVTKSDLFTLKHLTSNYHEVTQLGRVIDEPVRAAELFLHTRDLQIGFHPAKFDLNHFLSFSDVHFGVHQTTSLGWQLATFAGRFAREPTIGQNVDNMMRRVTRVFGPNYTPVNPTIVAQRAFNEIFEQPLDVCHLEDLALLNQFNVFLKQSAKVGGAHRVALPNLFNKISATRQSFIPKNQHKLEVPSTTEAERSAGNKLKGGQPVNSTDPIVSLYLGTVVRVMSYFLRNCVKSNFVFMCGDELSPEVCEEVYIRYHIPGLRYKASDVKSMDTVHSVFTYEFFSSLFKLFMQRVFHFEYDFMDVFMALVPNWFTKSMTLDMRARVHYYLSSGLPWTLMLNIVTCLYISGIQMDYGDIIFGLYMGDDSLEQIRDKSCPESNMLIHLGIEAKIKYTYHCAEFIHKIFCESREGLSAGSYTIITRAAAKFLSKRFSTKTIFDHTELREYMQGFRETLRKDLSYERFHDTIMANILYHGEGSEPSLYAMMDILNIICCSSISKLSKLLIRRERYVCRATRELNSIGLEFAACGLFQNLKIIMSNVLKRQLGPGGEPPNSASRFEGQGAEQDAKQRYLAAKKQKIDRLYCVPALFDAMGYSIPNEVYDAPKFATLAEWLKNDIVVTDSFNQIGFRVNPNEVPFRLLVNASHTHAISLCKIGEVCDDLLDPETLLVAMPPKIEAKRNKKGEIIEVTEIKKSKKGGKQSQPPKIRERVTVVEPAPRNIPFMRKIGSSAQSGGMVVRRSSRPVYKAVRSQTADFAKSKDFKSVNMLRTILDPVSMAKPMFLPFDQLSMFVSDQKSVNRENIKPLKFNNDVYAKFIVSDSLWAQYYEGVNNYGVSQDMIVLNCEVATGQSVLKSIDDRYDTYEATTNQPANADIATGGSAQLTLHTATALGLATTDVITVPQMLDMDIIGSYFGTGDVKWSQEPYYSYIPGETITVNVNASTTGSCTLSVSFSVLVRATVDGTLIEGQTSTLGSGIISGPTTEINPSGTLTSTAGDVVGYKFVRISNTGSTLNIKRVIVRHAVLPASYSPAASGGIVVCLSRLAGRKVQSIDALLPIIESYRPLASSVLLTSTSSALTENGNIRMNQIVSGKCPSDSKANKLDILNDQNTYQGQFKKGAYSAPFKYGAAKVPFNGKNEIFPFWQPYTVIYVDAKNAGTATVDLSLILQICTWYQLKLEVGQQIKNVYAVKQDVEQFQKIQSFLGEKRFMTENPLHLGAITNALKKFAPIGSSLMRSSDNKYLNVGADIIDGISKLF